VLLCVLVYTIVCEHSVPKFQALQDTDRSYNLDIFDASVFNVHSVT